MSLMSAMLIGLAVVAIIGGQLVAVWFFLLMAILFLPGGRR